jgi:L-alanine-DL-glutamate epimerase-like enolase superfamily enzyme
MSTPDGGAAPRLRLLAVDVFERPFRLRLPFRFGLHTLTQARQAVVRVQVQHEGGGVAWGYAAEVLLPKWFDKRPELTPADNENQLRQAVRNAAQAYLAERGQTAFGLFANTYEPLMQAGAAADLPPLVVGYGPALLDRAILDSLCRARRVGLWEAMRRNLPGLTRHAIAADCDEVDFDAFLGQLSPVSVLRARHTVGMLDPLAGPSASTPDLPRDGLPVTLEDVIATYGNTHFKLKLGGDIDRDIDRLSSIARVLDRSSGDYVVTLDGNEQYGDARAVVELCQRMAATPALRRLHDATLFIEQPIGRAAALSENVDAIARFKPVLLDESDGTLDTFPRGKALGYQGVSSKSCKGIYKSVINRLRCERWNRAQGRPTYFMSAEDLIIQPGLSLQQDLALAALLGIDHIERNGHHYVDRFLATPDAEARALAAAHPDLYASEERPALRIDNGCISVASSGLAQGFGSSEIPTLEGSPSLHWSA